MPKSISFCTTCCNRLWQLQQTLPHNLDSIRDEHEIVLVDYGSSDGLAQWVWGNFADDIQSGRLVFFEVTNEVKWNCPRAKNLAHRLAGGDYLFNIDADNFITAKDLSLIGRAIHRGVPCHQWSGDWQDGSFGRIGIPRDLFRKIGGYDETLMAMGGQDVDLIGRMTAVMQGVKLPKPQRPAVQNTMSQKAAMLARAAEAGDDKREAVLEEMNRLSLAICKIKLEAEGPIRLGGGFSYKGRLNGRSVVISGFDEIRDVPG